MTKKRAADAAYAWAYFTRTDRKVYPSQSLVYYTCTECEAEVRGRTVDIVSHHKKCPRIGSKEAEKDAAGVVVQDSIPRIPESRGVVKVKRAASSRQRSMTSSADRPFDSTELAEFEEKLVRFTAKLNLPFSWIEESVTRELCQVMRPEVARTQLPTTKRLSEVLLRSYAANMQENSPR